MYGFDSVWFGVASYEPAVPIPRYAVSNHASNIIQVFFIEYLGKVRHKGIA